MKQAFLVALGVAVLSLCAGVSDAQTLRPSFDCARATLPDEKAICGDDRLAQLDAQAAAVLGQIAPDVRASARESAADLLKDRHACGANKVCILDVETHLLATLDDLGGKTPPPSWVGRYRLDLLDGADALFTSDLPVRIGTCTRTKIAKIATRFGEPLKKRAADEADSGSAVDFTNGGHQVSYAYEADIAESAVGDDIVLCLVSIPKNCPPGDDRGRLYSATNVRTKGSWILPDAQHMCGGA